MPENMNAEVRERLNRRIETLHERDYTRIIPYGDVRDVSTNYAIQGFRELAWLEHDGIRPEDIALNPAEAVPSTRAVPVGSIAHMTSVFEAMAIKPRDVALPPILPRRRVVPLREALDIAKTTRIFVKSARPKVMDAEIWGPTTGFVVLAAATMHLSHDEPVVVDEPIDEIVSEYRVMVLRGEIVACRHYSGFPLVFPDPGKIELDVGALENIEGDDGKWAPCAYSADFMVYSEDTQYRTRLVEVNDAWALGEYGTPPHIYAKMLRARWLQLLRERR